MRRKNLSFSRRDFLASSAGVALLARDALGASRLPTSALGVTQEDRQFLDDFAHRCFLYFTEQIGPRTGIVMDRSGMDGSGGRGDVGSTAATGFGLTALCIGASRGWISKERARSQVLLTLRYYWQHAFHDHGWFYHFMDVHNGTRRLNSEISSIDTTLFLCGALTAAGYFQADREIQVLTKEIFERVDFAWMLNGHQYLLSHGVMPDSGFIKARWDAYSEASALYLLAIGSPRHPIPARSWYMWIRPQVKYEGWEFISGGPLFTHQFSHAWIDFRHQMDGDPSYINYFENSQYATYAHRDFCVNLKPMYSGYGNDMWGITASDSPNGYVAWGGPPDEGPINGTLVPCAAAGSLMFSPEICLPVLREMRRAHGEKIYQRYGFTDAFHPNWKNQKLWVNRDVIGIDVGISLLSIENLLTGNVWRWFKRNPYIETAMDRAGFSISTPGVALRTVKTGARRI